MTATSSAICATTPRSWVISRIEVPYWRWRRREVFEDGGLHGDVEGGGGFVEDQDLRVEGGGDRDHYSLRHAAGELERVARTDLLWLGQTHLVEHLDGASPGFAFGYVQVGGDNLFHLLPDGEDRVESCRRVLEHHTDVASADATELFAFQRQEVAALEQDAARS